MLYKEFLINVFVKETVWYAKQKEWINLRHFLWALMDVVRNVLIAYRMCRNIFYILTSFLHLNLRIDLSYNLFHIFKFNETTILYFGELLKGKPILFGYKCWSLNYENLKDIFLSSGIVLQVTSKINTPSHLNA